MAENILEQISKQVQAYMRTLPYVRAAPEYPPDKAQSGIFSVAYPYSGTWDQAPAGMKRGVCVIRLEFYLAKSTTSADLKLMYPLLEDVPNLLYSKLNETLFEGLVTSIGPIDFQGFRTTKFNDIDHWIVSFSIRDVKIKSVI